jgi:hypothetical protein
VLAGFFDGSSVDHCWVVVEDERAGVLAAS